MPNLADSWQQARRLYLDQQQWIRLAKGAMGKDPEASKLHEAIERLVADGIVVVPLSAAHWAETWHRGDWRSRWRLADVMWRTSRLVAFAPFHEFIEPEIDLELHRRLGRPAWPRQIEALGVGVNHAWASEHGRLRHVEWTDGHGGEGKSVDPPDIIVNLHRHQYEWLSLAGPPLDMRLDGLDLGPFRRAGEEWASWESEVSAFLQSVRRPEQSRWVAWYQFQDIWRQVVRRCDNIGTSPEIAIGRGLVEIEKFLSAMQVENCLLQLRKLRHQNPRQRWALNDRLDLIALAVAIPFSHVVVTERQWAHLAQRAGLDERYGSFITSSLAEGVDFLLA